MARHVLFPRRRAQGQHAQSMVEFALIAPFLFFVMFLLIDFGRLVYTYAAVSWSAREAARVVSMQPQADSDCLALSIAESTAQGFILRPDENSVVNNSDPNGTGTPNADPRPPAGMGKIYIWPAVATAAPADAPANCSGSPRAISPTVQDVAVQIKYTFLPLMPLISNIIPPITITSISVVHTEY
ncbi:MAG: pilus assembly protein [Chloroflexi bacterium]|nr:MAG: pilus assembly protein [Chloroflexota bacterium]